MKLYQVGDRFYTREETLHEVAAIEGQLFFAVPIRESKHGELIRNYAQVKVYSFDPAGGFYPVDQTISNTIQ